MAVAHTKHWYGPNTVRPKADGGHHFVIEQRGGQCFTPWGERRHDRAPGGGLLAGMASVLPARDHIFPWGRVYSHGGGTKTEEERTLKGNDAAAKKILPKIVIIIMQ